MKAFIEDKKAINNLLDSFDDNHKNIFAKLKALNTGSWEAYFHHLSINKMIPLTLRVLSPTGMQAFGKRVAIYTSSLGKFEDFLKNTKRFGTTLQEFLKESCQDTLYQTLTNLLTKKYADWMNQPLQTQ